MQNEVETAAAKAAPPQGRLPAGTLLADRFLLEAFGRHTAFGELYQARDQASGDPVSVHVVRTEFNGSRVADAILASCESVAGVSHKNLTQVVYAGTQRDELFVVSELIDGHPLRDLLARKQRTGSAGFGARGTANIVSGVLAALDSLTSSGQAVGGLGHGAIGTETVFVNTAGRVKLVDVGLGAASAAAVKAGLMPRPDNLAPEVGTLGEPSPAGDIYAMGRLIYELLVGQPLVKGGPRPSEAAGVDASVDEVIARCCSQAPSKRWNSPAELRDAVLAALKKPGTTSSPSIRLPAQKAQTDSGGAAVSAQFSSSTSVVSRAKSSGAADAARTQAKLPQRSTGELSSPAIKSSSFGGEEERFLISKGKLDFGPFSVATIIEDVRTDQILPGHIIVDKDTGARCTVEDHPLLTDELDRAKQRRDDMRRSEAEEQHTKTETRKGTALYGFIAMGVLALAVGVYFLVNGKQTAPFAPAVVAQQAKGAQPGHTEWEYAVVALRGEGKSKVISEKRALSDGAAALAPKGPKAATNRISWQKVSGAKSYVIYRTRASGTPASTGAIGRVDANTREFIDSGQEGDGANLEEAIGALEDGQLMAKLSFPKPPKRAKRRKTRRRTKGSKHEGNDDSGGDSAMDFSREGGNEILDQSRINPVIQTRGRRLARCLLSKGARRADIEFVIKRTGRVSKVTVTGANSAATACIQSVVKSMKFPSFDGNYTIARFDMSL